MIRASSGLSDDEIKRMVKDAEAHAAEDRQFRELVETRNRADAMIHSVDKALKDLGDKVSADERAKAEAAMNDLKSALGSDDKEVIEKKTEILGQASAAIAQRAYAGNQPGGASPGATGPGGERAGGGAARVAARRRSRRKMWSMRSSRKYATRASRVLIRHGFQGRAVSLEWLTRTAARRREVPDGLCLSDLNRQ